MSELLSPTCVGFDGLTPQAASSVRPLCYKGKAVAQAGIELLADLAEKQEKKKCRHAWCLLIIVTSPPTPHGGHPFNAMSEFTTRLHITPLTPDILPSVLPASLRAAATDISFHAIPTFPEKSYGYITLPNMEAEKIKKKLNGSILKGKKFKIESARPSKRQRHEDEAEAEDEPVKAEKKKSKKHKSEDQVLDGYELSPDRKVKRGWTEPSGSKKDKRRSEKKSKDEKKEKPQAKSKYTEKPECLFRTTIPPNRSKETADDKKAKNNKKSSESVVHEFEKMMTYPSFLRSTGDGSVQTATFDEEKGWVDATGAVKEAPSQKARKHDYRPGQVAGTKLKGSSKSSSQKEKVPTPELSSESEDWTSSSGSSDESSDSQSEASSSDGSSDESSDEQPQSSAEGKAASAPASSVAGDPASTPLATTNGSESKVAVAPEEVENKEVHPLEALFKRSAPVESQNQPTPDADAGFSFFGNNDNDIESEDEIRPVEPQPPFTPFTKRDLQVRGLRSAAPTPDTGLPSRHKTWTEDAMEDDEVSIDSPVSKSREVELDAAKEETEFTKWFWENRGENNRAWKKRRRDVAKEQRQRDNRKKGMKGKS